jgi:hypothetical protein
MVRLAGFCGYVLFVKKKGRKDLGLIKCTLLFHKKHTGFVRLTAGRDRGGYVGLVGFSGYVLFVKRGGKRRVN